MKRISRFSTRRTMVNVVGVLVIVSMLVGAAWPAGHGRACHQPPA